MPRLSFTCLLLFLAQIVLATLLFTVFQAQLIRALQFYHAMVGPVFLFMLYSACLSITHLMLHKIKVSKGLIVHGDIDFFTSSKNLQSVVLTLGTLGTFIAMAIAHESGGITLDTIPVALYSTIAALTFSVFHNNISAVIDTQV